MAKTIKETLLAEGWCYTYDLEKVGEYGTPEIKPEQIDVSKFDWIGFNYATGIKRESPGLGVHFFVPDYRFCCTYTHLNTYTRALSKFGVLCTPDFSMYTDYPKVLQLYSHYRKHVVGAYWQKNGLKVIPTISWGQPETFEWCFDGEPVGGVVAISSNGIGKDKEVRAAFKEGFDQMMRRLVPSKILWLGEVFEECDGPVYQIPSFAAQRWRGKQGGTSVVKSFEGKVRRHK